MKRAATAPRDFGKYDAVDIVIERIPARFTSSINRIINAVDKVVHELDEWLCLHPLDLENRDNAYSAERASDAIEEIPSYSLETLTTSPVGTTVSIQDIVSAGKPYLKELLS